MSTKKIAGRILGSGSAKSKNVTVKNGLSKNVVTKSSTHRSYAVVAKKSVSTRAARSYGRLEARAKSADTDLETLVTKAEDAKRLARVQAQREGLSKFRGLQGMKELAKLTGAENTKSQAS